MLEVGRAFLALIQNMPSRKIPKSLCTTVQIRSITSHGCIKKMIHKTSRKLKRANYNTLMQKVQGAVFKSDAGISSTRPWFFDINNDRELYDSMNI